MITTADLHSRASTRLRSPAVIAGTVGLAATVAVVQASVVDSVLGAVMVFALVPCALIDLERRIIPNRITGPAAVLAIALGLALGPGGEPRRLLWAGIAGGFLLITALAHPAGMGMRDVRLLGMIGLFLGAPVVVALIVALLGSAVTGIVLARRHGVAVARRRGCPSGPTSRSAQSWPLWPETRSAGVPQPAPLTLSLRH